MRLDRSWIEQNIPHHGRMCLLDEVLEWDAQHIRCRSGTHRQPDHPLRSQGRLGAACGIEYAAQAMAVHGALAGGAVADASGVGALAGGALADGSGGSALAGSGAAGAGTGRSEAGFLAALREVRLHVLRLDDIDGDLYAEALLVAGDQGSALYEFTLRSDARLLLSGRATVVFDASQRARLTAEIAQVRPPKNESKP
jgi:predicted hotdog family 3-hydroxylacyl-ACP dehydratase